MIYPSRRGKTASTDLLGSLGFVGLFGLVGLVGLVGLFGLVGLVGLASLVGPFCGQSNSFLGAALWFRSAAPIPLVRLTRHDASTV